MLSKIVWILAFTGLLLISCSSVSKNCNENSTSNENPTWMNETMTVTGQGSGPEDTSDAQRPIMAERAARLSAVAKMMTQIQNLPYNGKTVGEYLPKDWSLRDFSTDNVEHNSDGTCNVTLSLPLSKVWEVLPQNRK